MNKDRKIERQENDIQRLRDMLAELQHENSALKKTLADKNARIEMMEAAQDELYDRWQEHVKEHAQAIEEAYEAKMQFAEECKKIAEIRERYKKEMGEFMRRFRNSMLKGKP